MEREAQPTKTAAVEQPQQAGADEKAGANNKDFQVGIPGQSMEPLISKCAKTERSCIGIFCGC
ncbi:MULTISPECIES: hypothetical protein [unclassified Hyphomicrobium]|uniref:hypothetical protein n=1 Tax=unclassified Hyphomicrobium TaxID=2619925 RepID=UPI000213ED0D|nr:MULTISPECIES: hypothetical protein [unclassified Hyphomicrobium]CCB64117.1 protein of unknown function [Hyphomicrobium sp. MC1]